MSETTQQTTTEWAREHGQHARWYAALDNYEPRPRNTGAGDLWFYDLTPDTRGRGIVVENADQFRDMGRGCAFFVDDGTTVEPFYVAAWHPEGSHLILHPMPVNVTPMGYPILREDDGRPVDYSSWMLGPRTTYHLKITRS